MTRRGAPATLHLLGVLVTAMLITGLAPDAAVAASVPVVAGRPAGTIGPGDGIKLLVRYLDADNFYAVHINRRDGGMRIQRKHDGVYHSLESTRPPGFLPTYGRAQAVTVTVADQPDGSVELRLEVDGQLRHRAVDRGQTPAGTPLRRAGHLGLRADNTEFLLDDVRIAAADADGRATGPLLVDDDLDRPAGLITNQRAQSVRDAVWQVTSGSLFAVGGRAWSGMPDDVRPDPESRWATNSSTFRMLTRRSDLRDIRAELTVTTVGMLDPDRLPPVPAPSPPAYPTGTDPVRIDRLDGRSMTHVAITASRTAFPAGAPAAVLVPRALSPELVAAPALAGALGGPILLTDRDVLHPDTAAELVRLGVRSVHVIGEVGPRVRDELGALGLSVRRPSSSTPPEITAWAAREVQRRGGGDRAVVVTDATWESALVFSAAAAAERTPILLTAPDRLDPATARTLTDLDVAAVTLVGNDLAPEVVAALRAQGVQVDQGGHGRYSAARHAAERQRSAGRRAAQLWVAAGARPLHILAAGPAADAVGAILLVVDGAELGDVSLEDLGYTGEESRHWARRHRRELARLRAIGPHDAVHDRVLQQLAAEQVSIVAGLRDIAGTTHEHAIRWLVESGRAAGFSDATFRPSDPVTRGQMATMLATTLGLEPSDSRFVDVAPGSTHHPAISAIAAAGITSGYPDGSFRPSAPVRRAHLAAFLATALELDEAAPDLRDVDPTDRHAAAIGAVVAAGYARGFDDGTFRPDDPVTRGQMATILRSATAVDTARPADR